MNLDWTALLVAVLALVGTLSTAIATRRKSQKPTIIDQAGQVAQIATLQLESVVREVEALRAEVATYKAEIDRIEAEREHLKDRVVVLEREILKLGGVIPNGG